MRTAHFALVLAAVAESACSDCADFVAEIRWADVPARQLVQSYKTRVRVDGDDGREEEWNGPESLPAVLPVAVNHVSVTEGSEIEFEVLAYSGEEELIAGGFGTITAMGACDPPLPIEIVPPSITVNPGRIDVPRMDLGTSLTVEATITASGGVDLEALPPPISSVPWLSTELEPTGRRRRTLTLTLTASTANLDVGRPEAEVRVRMPGIADLAVPVRVAVFRPVHVGPTSDACVRDRLDGGQDRTCDFLGDNLGAVPTLEYDHLILHGREDGEPAFYEAPPREGMSLPANTWLSAAAGVEPDKVVLLCGDGNQGEARAVRLAGDGVRIEGFMVLSRGFCDPLITSWTAGDPEQGTRGHEIDRMILAALRPERFGQNGIEFPLGLSATTTVSNSHVYGYWHGVGDLRFARGTKLIGNTFIFYQRLDRRTDPDAAMIATGIEGLHVENNVFVAVSGADKPLILADAETTGLVVSGNVIGGFGGRVIEGTREDRSHRVDLNTIETIEVEGAARSVGTAFLESPFRPRFLDDIPPPPLSRNRRSIGTSLDGVDLSGRDHRFPGAFQRPSERCTAPDRCERCDTLRLARGASNSPCALDATEIENAVQVAAWSLWPGETLPTVLIEPGTYAGNVVVTWPVRIEGTPAATAQEVILRNEGQNVLWLEGGTWSRHQAIVTVTWHGHGTEIRNLEVDVAAEEGHALFLEGDAPERMTSSRRTAARTVVVRRDQSQQPDRPEPAVRAGHRVLVQDTLIEGNWRSCALVAVDPGGISSSLIAADFIHVTCRLDGAAPPAAFETVDVAGATFINVVAEVQSTLPMPAPSLFLVGGTLPRNDGQTRFTAHSVHHFGIMTNRVVVVVEGNNDGNYELTNVEPLNDSPLVPGSTLGQLRTDLDPNPIDSGVPPREGDDENPWPAGLSLGRSVNGVDRNELPPDQIDRGAHEQGRLN